MELKDIENESQRRYGMGYEELMTPEQDQITMNPAETQEDPFRKDSRKDKIKEWILRGLTKDQIIDRLMEGFAMNREDAEQMYLDEAISGTVGKTMRILKGEKDIEAEIRELELELNQAKKRGDRIAVQTIQERIDGLKSKKSISKATELPIYKIRGKYYYRDTRLNEFRNVKDPNDRIPIDDVSLEDLETPGKEDQEEVYGKSVEKSVQEYKGHKYEVYYDHTVGMYVCELDGDYLDAHATKQDAIDRVKDEIDLQVQRESKSIKKDKKLDAIHDALVREGKAEDPWALAQWIRQRNKSWDEINNYIENMKSKQIFMEKENTSQDPYVKSESNESPKEYREAVAWRKFHKPYDELTTEEIAEIEVDYEHFTGENKD